MAIILDILVVLALVFFVVRGIIRGFVKEAVSLLSIVIALVLALFFSNIIAGFVYDTFFEESIEKDVYEMVESNLETDVVDDGFQYVKIPDSIYHISDVLDIEMEDYFVSNGSDMEQSIQSVTDDLVEKYVRPAVVIVIRIVLFIILYIIFRLLTGWIAKVINLITYIPVIHSANKLLGGVLGFLKGFAIISAVSFAIAYIVDVSVIGVGGIDYVMIDETVLFEFFANIFR